GFTLKALCGMLINLAVGIFDKAQIGNQAAQEAGGEKLEKVSNNVAGPIGILGIIFPAAREAGLTTLVMLTAIISLTLAVMNVLPIPGLDGGRWFLMALFKVLKKPLTKEREEKIVATGMMVLFGLIILVTIADIGKLGG
ncbi:MAG TPA: site-2 protease family protein, partial [Candidatus Saccharimonadales bacterium]|nr:site-2 protease family protein [Candidatus Saccharimonadales bacterium]